ncbi:MAG: MMPL family transporter, partial [Gammaproteobacteria bacterium]|nr:MMPL family transporter [Gammaproteobacteria bacterium]
SAERGGLKSPERLRVIRAFQDWAEAQPEIDRAFGMPDFIEEMHWGFHAEKPEYRTLPDDERLISQYLLIYDGDDIYDFVDRDFQHSMVALNLNVHRANEIASVLDRARDWLQQNAGDELEWEIAGAGRLFADMEELLVTGQTWSLLGALVLVFLLMLLLFRSVAAAALCMIPNMSPILLVFIIMGAAGIWLDMATAMIASVAVGIAVDDTIHVFHGFRHRLDRGIDATVALARTYREAGRAVVVTTIILSAQFLILVFSDFVPTRNFGMLTTVGLVAALVFDLMLLPALLMIFYGNNSPVAHWIGRLRGGSPDRIAEQTLGIEDVGFDRDLWTAERKIALVREILAGRADAGSAARDHALPEDEVRRWVRYAERGIDEALGAAPESSRRDPEKVRALARAYKRLQDENRELKAKQSRS